MKMDTISLRHDAIIIICCLYLLTYVHATDPVRLVCNKTLAAGSILALTDKLDLSGRQPDQPHSIKDQCAIIGPSGNEFATILVPSNDCVLLAQGEVTISGNVRFVVGHKSKKFDCCDDGESHGGILCSYTNLTIAENSIVNIETTPGDDTVVINPGAFWTGKFINVHGIVNASLKYGQLTGLNGILSSNGIRVSARGKVIGSGMKTVRGAAIQGGDDGTVLNGTVECNNYTAGDAGGCIAAGNYFSVGSTAIIRTKNAFSTDSGVAISGSDMSTYPFFGKIIAENMNTTDAGAVLNADTLTMSGNSSIVANNVISSGGSTVISCTDATMNEHSTIFVNNSVGSADGGAIEVTLLTMIDDSKIFCENGYADNGGACILGSLEMDGRATITTRNMTAKELGGAISGAYPKQYLTVQGNATIDIDGSHAGLYGGALFFWENISFVGEAFHVSLRNSAASCGGGIVSLGSSGLPGDGNIYLDTSRGGSLEIVNAKELNQTKGCLTIQANLYSGNFQKQGPRIRQPCGSGCGSSSVSSSCMCRLLENGNGFQECCTKKNKKYFQ